MVHRDLKPDNVLLEASEDFAEGYRAFLADFRIAKVVEEGADEAGGLTGTGMSLGTPTYMAPEQVLGQPLNGRADLYAFGVLLFEALTGSVPYAGVTPMGLAIQQCRATCQRRARSTRTCPPAWKRC